MFKVSNADICTETLSACYPTNAGDIAQNQCHTKVYFFPSKRWLRNEEYFSSIKCCWSNINSWNWRRKWKIWWRFKSSLTDRYQNGTIYCQQIWFDSYYLNMYGYRCVITLLERLKQAKCEGYLLCFYLSFNPLFPIMFLSFVIYLFF